MTGFFGIESFNPPWDVIFLPLFNALIGLYHLLFNDLALALQPELAPGDDLELALVKPGKERHQAVGYLPNGAMIVVNHAASFIGDTVAATVSSTLQTSAGRMIFAELKPPASPASG